MERWVLALAVALAAAAVATPASACPGGLKASPLDSLQSARAKPGEPFRFRIMQGGELLGRRIPAGTVGYGVVRAVAAAGSRNRNGDIALEPRYLMLGKRQVPVAIDPTAPVEYTPRTSLVQQAAGHIPIPLPGMALTAINTLRHGRNVTIGPGTVFSVVGVPDLARNGVCDAG